MHSVGLVVAASQTRLVDPIALFIFDHYLRFRLESKLPKQVKIDVLEDPLRVALVSRQTTLL